MLQSWARPSTAPIRAAVPWRLRKLAPAVASKTTLCKAAGGKGPAAGSSGDGDNVQQQVPVRKRTPKQTPQGGKLEQAKMTSKVYLRAEEQALIAFVKERCVFRPFLHQPYCELHEAYVEFLEERQQAHLAVSKKRLWPLLQIVTGNAGLGPVKRSNFVSTVFYQGITGVKAAEVESTRQEWGLGGAPPGK